MTRTIGSRLLAGLGLLTLLSPSPLRAQFLPVDTAGGIVYFGATYVALDSTLLAVQFWAPAFRRSTDWMVGALAHEAFHAFHPAAHEGDAVAFGNRCREAPRLPTALARSVEGPFPSIAQSGSAAKKW